MWLCISVAFWTMALFNGCATEGLSQIDDIPPLTVVGSLKPAFEWTPLKESGVWYELIICVGIKDPRGFWIPGKTACYRKGITTAKYALNQPLSPDTVYVWSVRARSGERKSKWAAYGDGDSNSQRGGHHYDIMYPFKTPGN
jgi:hypothetical protein